MKPFYISIVSKYLNSSFDMINLKKLCTSSFDYVPNEYIYHNDGIFI